MLCDTLGRIELVDLSHTNICFCIGISDVASNFTSIFIFYRSILFISDKNAKN